MFITYCSSLCLCLSWFPGLITAIILGDHPTTSPVVSLIGASHYKSIVNQQRFTNGQQPQLVLRRPVMMPCWKYEHWLLTLNNGSSCLFFRLFVCIYQSSVGERNDVAGLLWTHLWPFDQPCLFPFHFPVFTNSFKNKQKPQISGKDKAHWRGEFHHCKFLWTEQRRYHYTG